MQLLTTHPTLIDIFRILEERENLQLGAFSARDVKLVRQVTRLLDEALPWQRGHGTRTARLAEALGTAAGLSDDALQHLTLASLLHDIGLLVLPNGLTSPSGCLDSRSYAAVQCHPRLGPQWLEPFPSLRRASVIIAHHHERWDGSGYPYGIRGTFIPVEARILAIADAFDAVEVPGIHDHEVRDRVAYRILNSAAGTQFDPQLIELCWPGLREPLGETAWVRATEDDDVIDSI
jgi:HD-GYP domain-containing protein (c-di-GMP phosphodiesterase class II)